MSNSHQFKIDEEFRSHIPPLRADELSQLEANLKREGCKSPLIVWRDVLLDGHNRFDICERNGIEFETEEIELADRDAAIAWIEENQLGRRNLTADQFSYFIGRKYDRLKRAPHRPLSEEKGSQNENLTKTEDVVAAQHGIGRATVHRAAEYARNVDAIADEIGQGARTELLSGSVGATRAEVKEIAEAVKGGKAQGLTFSNAKEVHNWVKAERETKAKVRAEENRAVARREAKVPTGLFETIVIDPPWPMQKIERDVRPNQVSFDYPVMTEEEISAFGLGIEYLMAEDCHMFMWTTHKFLPMALRILEKWDFRYVLTMVWHKPGGFQPIGLPQYNCEFVLYARRGKPSFADTKAFPCCFEAPRREHSRKPDEFYETIARVTAGTRLDIFSRGAHEGFARYGNESEKFSGAA